MQTRDPITNLINAFTKLPGIGERTASRLAFFILNQPIEVAEEIASALIEVKREIGFCERCCNLTKEKTCTICAAPKRDQHTICIVESTPDLRAVENTGEFYGTYHVLHGLISPLEGIGPDDLKIKELLTRLGQSEISELIVATSPSVNGEATALYLQKLIKPFEIKMTRIASGIPIGGDLEYIDRVTLSRALSQRREI